MACGHRAVQGARSLPMAGKPGGARAGRDGGWGWGPTSPGLRGKGGTQMAQMFSVTPTGRGQVANLPHWGGAGDTLLPLYVGWA